MEDSLEDVQGLSRFSAVESQPWLNAVAVRLVYICIPLLTMDGMPPPIRVQHNVIISAPSGTCIKQHLSSVCQIPEMLEQQSLNNKENYIASEGMMHS